MTRNMAAKVCVVLACLMALPSCNNWIYDEEGDCTVYYRLKFRYDKNLKWADAFANEVSSVHLYAFDPSGVLVWQREEVVEPSMAENYTMLLDLPAGDYQLLAWCGLRNDGEHEESFSVPEARTGETRIEQLQCALNRKHDEAGASYSNERLYRLFHGTLDVSLPTNDDGGSYDYTMHLTKNTNHIRVILQHLSGEDIDVNQFSFQIEDENGLMAHDNELMEDENIIYRPWKLQNGEARLEKDTRAITDVKLAIADLTVGRMMETHREKMLLTITNQEDKKKVVSIPVIDYALLAKKDYYEDEYRHRITDQDFLDRVDECVLTFFLDKNYNWLSCEILINSWRIIHDNYDLEM